MLFGGREQRKSGIWARKSLLSKKGCRTGFCWVYSDLKTLGANRKAMMFIANADPLSSAFILFYFPYRGDPVHPPSSCQVPQAILMENPLLFENLKKKQYQNACRGSDF